ncbi:MAG: hypothetical protein CVT92_14140 [Bacteroidetes bacterium HGW-Bacteroidetes-1]|jgi:hypothetical protein|nr:MAG: hypothetical protein CVT92_14140 [Bacteroidetes bacterium HGW-Bacteroidetes-1]
MKKADFVLIAIILAILFLFILKPEVLEMYSKLNNEHGMWLSFIKFAILATFGECLALRIRTGKYNSKGFGILPRAIVWGFLGLTIKMAFVIFSTGTPLFLEYLGLNNAVITMISGFSLMKVFIAFCISLTMNLIYAPVMMTIHRITDMHIISNGGTLVGFFHPIQMRKNFNQLDWDSLWNFVFKKTIPFFWIPAHTITFLLPEGLQVLFAALLGIALGVILSTTQGKN